MRALFRFGMLLTIGGSISSPQPAAAAEAKQVLLSSIGSERATQGNGNKIVTFRGKTHVVWQDADAKGYFARVRTLDHKTGKWSPTYTLGKGRDNHARPTKNCLQILGRGIMF